MTGKTHRAGGALCSVVGFLVLKDNGLLLDNVNQFVQLAVMYPFCMWGSVASDLDHHWESCPSKDIPSWTINKVLHLTTPIRKKLDDTLSNKQKKSSWGYKLAGLFSASHRSWQTHSDLTLLLMLWLYFSILNGGVGSSFLGVFDVPIVSLIVMGVCLGIIAHFILDLLTPEGVWNMTFVVINRLRGKSSEYEKGALPEHWHIVPKFKCFRTGSSWETFVRNFVKFLTVVSVIYLLLKVAFPDVLPSIMDMIPYEITFN